MSVVTLNENEVRIAKFLGTKRHNANREKGIVDRQVSQHDPIQMDIDGVGAELAFCKWANVYPDTGDTPGKFDALLRSGYFVDVKHTRYRNGHLIQRIGSPDQADLYVLVIGTCPDYNITGWATSADLKASIIDLGYGDTYGIGQRHENFHQPETFPR